MRITDQAKIRDALDAAMQSGKLLVEIKDRAKNIVYVGAVPLSATTSADGAKVYSLTNSDAGYNRTIGQVALADIEFVTILDER